MSSWKKRNRIRRKAHKPSLKFIVKMCILRSKDDVTSFTSLDDWLEEEGILEQCESTAKERLGLL